MSSSRKPSVEAAQQALEAFQRVWVAVGTEARSQVANERNEVRRFLRDTIAYLESSSSDEDDEEEDEDDEDEDDAPDSEDGDEEDDEDDEPAPTPTPAITAVLEAIGALSEEERDDFFDLLERRFCLGCSESFAADEDARDHDCPYDEELGICDEEDDLPPSSRKPKTKARPKPRLAVARDEPVPEPANDDEPNADRE